jgi:hypothetical protein
MGADSGHHEHRSPSTRVATEARGWRSTFRRSVARLVPPGDHERAALAGKRIPEIILDGRQRLDRAGTNQTRILGRSVRSSDGDRVRIPRGLE